MAKGSIGIGAVFALAMSARERKADARAPHRLNGLFRDLALAAPPRPADDIEELIWAIWIGHGDADAAARMAIAAETMASGELELARPLLDALVGDYPDWAEAWNKRATLSFIEKADRAAIADIGETLRLEPRHFGALAGFAQICLRNDRPHEARALFQLALAINPHLQGLAEIIADLGKSSTHLH